MGFFKKETEFIIEQDENIARKILEYLKETEFIIEQDENIARKILEYVKKTDIKMIEIELVKK